VVKCTGFGYNFFIMYAGPKVMMIMTSALWNIVKESEMDMGWVGLGRIFQHM